MTNFQALAQRALRTLACIAASLTLGAATLPAQAAESSFPLDHFPTEKLTDLPSLQNGARLFVNYCLNCHGAASMRYNRLRDIGLTEEQIKANLMFAADKVGEPMRTALSPKDAKEWFGAVPPDLSVTARAKASHSGTGSDWLYTYLRAYYRDSTRSTGWNNALYPNVGMPNPFWEVQGASRGATFDEIRNITDEKTGKVTGASRTVVVFDEAGRRTEKTEPIAAQGGHLPHPATKITLTRAAGGKLDQAAFDDEIADLVAYMTYMADPSAKTRTRLGVWVLVFLSVFAVFAWALNKAYWKDIK